jgi:hypothetical protein
MRTFKTIIITIILLGIIASCIPVMSPVIITPPNPRIKQLHAVYENKSLEQILKEEISKSPIKVIIGNNIDFKKEYLIPNNLNFENYENVIGIFSTNSKITEKYPKVFIFLNEKNRIGLQITTLYHELGHYNCHRTGCPCLNSPVKIVAEYHAFESQIEMSIVSGQIEVMKETIYSILTLSLSEDTSAAHKMAAEVIMEKPIFLNLITLYSNKAKLYDSENFADSLFPPEK